MDNRCLTQQLSFLKVYSIINVDKTTAVWEVSSRADKKKKEKPAKSGIILITKY